MLYGGFPINVSVKAMLSCEQCDTVLRAAAIVRDAEKSNGLAFRVEEFVTFVNSV